jgi:TonB family protein
VEKTVVITTMTTPSASSPKTSASSGKGIMPLGDSSSITPGHQTTIEAASTAPERLLVAARKQRARFHSCYSKVILSDPAAAGRVVFELSFGAGGASTKVAILSPSGQTALDKCALDAAATMKLEAGEPMTGQLTVRFALLP